MFFLINFEAPDTTGHQIDHSGGSAKGLHMQYERKKSPSAVAGAELLEEAAEAGVRRYLRWDGPILSLPLVHHTCKG